MYTLGVITARGGSKRIPKKNVRDFCGKPLIAWTIEAVKASNVDAWFVSTDDVEIGETAMKHGGGVPFIRPSELSTDTAKSVDVLVHAVEWFESEFTEPTHVVLLQPTSPLRTYREIDFSLELISKSGKDSLVTMGQDGKPNGCLYITKRDMLILDHRIWDQSGVMLVQPDNMIDIDTEADWKEAEKLMRERQK
jgi:CMP-N,N'-diacetyllegionaminic acid synthase